MELLPESMGKAEGSVVEESEAEGTESSLIPIREFLESKPPGLVCAISDGFVPVNNFSPLRFELKSTGLELFCESCGGMRFFKQLSHQGFVFPDDNWATIAMRFRCRNCEHSIKLYSLLARIRDVAARMCWLWKLAEVPEFGPPIPAKIYKLIEEERDYYLRGRRSENQGLGIAAFAYYRRAVENQKNRIIDQVIKACRKLGSDPNLIKELEAAKAKVRFKESFGSIKEFLPQALMINGHNPIVLLHAALSEGIHGHSDEECLERAASIRLVLTELAERISTVLKEHDDLNAAVTKLMAAKSVKPVGT